jgi:Flp pilus assembly protein TadG
MHTSSRSSGFNPTPRFRLCRHGDVVGHQDFSARHRGESGTTLVLVALFVIALFGFAALTIDVGRVYKEKRHMQFATDAGAFAGVNMLNTNFSVGTPQDHAISEATDIAGANGVTASEISASDAHAIQVGYWDADHTNFVANAATLNAVRVSAKRTVDLTFAKVVGFSSMNPAVDSVATLGSVGRMSGPIIPVVVTADDITTNCLGHGNCYGYYLTLNNDDTVGSGKLGKVDLGVFEPTGSYKNGGKVWGDDMTTNGCNCTVSVGSVPAITGNADVQKAFAALPLYSTFVIPVVEQFDFTGSGTANIVGFVLVELTNYSEKGSKWTADVMFLASAQGDPSGGAIGGSCPPPCYQTRALVE